MTTLVGDALVVRDAATEYQLEGGEFAVATETALLIPDGATFADWQSLGGRLARVQQGLQWWLGDWLLHGEARHGETYQQALDTTAFDYQTLANCKFVANRIPPPRRRAGLSWSHHAEVAGLPEVAQERLLNLAVAERLTRDEFREHIRNERQVSRPGPTAGGAAPVVRVAASVEGLKTIITEMLTPEQREELVSNLLRAPGGLRFDDPARQRLRTVFDPSVLDGLPLSLLLGAVERRLPSDVPVPYTQKLGQLRRWQERHEADNEGVPGDEDAPPPPAGGQTVVSLGGALPSGDDEDGGGL